MKRKFDVAVIGSGFTGSILARILATQGRQVILIDAATHPRFAIGESSTPIADLLLRRLGERYGLQDLVDLSSFGTWQATHRELVCGMKRGFSYFDHRTGNVEETIGDRSMIVAASPTDDRSDTHWFRSDVDTHFFAKAISAGVVGLENAKVTGIDFSNDQHTKISLSTGESVEAGFVVDSSGAPAVSCVAAGQKPLTDRLATRSSTTFGHFRGVGSFSEEFNRYHGDCRAAGPFDADDAAQHHLIDDGWIWMLRFNNGITSVGLTCPYDRPNEVDRLISQSRRHFQSRFCDYPALNSVMQHAAFVSPAGGIRSVRRLQRLFDPVLTQRSILMPTTAVTIDPLHSTGIAHGLAGVERVAELVFRGCNDSELEDYRRCVLAEAEFIDRLVSLAYKTIGNFDRFSAACMVYFAAAIACEERIIAGDSPSRLWNADDDRFVEAVGGVAEILTSDGKNEEVIAKVRKRIAPWNSAGLFDRIDRRYAYTATK